MYLHTYCMLAPPKVVIEGPNQTDVRSSVSIRCNVLEGYPPPTVSITTPQEETIEQSLIIILHTTMTDAGNYTCIANNSLATVTSNLSLIVYGMLCYNSNTYICSYTYAYSYVCSYRFEYYINVADYIAT